MILPDDHHDWQFPVGLPTSQESSLMDEEHNTVEQVEDVMSVYPPLAPIDPPQVTNTFLIIPFPQPQQVHISNLLFV